MVLLCLVQVLTKKSSPGLVVTGLVRVAIQGVEGIQALP